MDTIDTVLSDSIPAFMPADSRRTPSTSPQYFREVWSPCHDLDAEKQNGRTLIRIFSTSNRGTMDTTHCSPHHLHYPIS
jgi:hypothetical protein